MRIEVWHGSIGDADVDALVNASNTILKLGSGVSHAIRLSCGPEFQPHLDEVLAARGGGVEPGDVVLTHAGAHPRARHVAHVAVMEFREGASAPAKPDEARLRRGYAGLWRALAELDEPGLSVGVVALGAGVGGFGLRASVGLACDTLVEHRAAGPTPIERVVFVAYELLECVNTLVAVEERFEVDAAPEEARALIGAIGR